MDRLGVELKSRTVGGFDRLATAVERVRRETGNVLLLDAGDAIADTAVAASTQGKAIVDLMNQLAYDAMTIGNHEPDFGMAVLCDRIGDARFDLVAANVVEAGSNRLFTKPFVIRTIDGVKIGILGISYPNTPLTTAHNNVASYKWRQAMETAAEYVPKLRKIDVDIVVVLSHLGLSTDVELAKAVPGIDVIVGGHSHNRMAQPALSQGTVIAQAGAHLSDLGRLDLTVESGKIVAVQGELITLDNATLPAQPAMAQRLQQLRLFVAGPAFVEAGSQLVRAQTLAGSEPRKRFEESPIDSLFADLIRERFATEVAFLPGVGYGVAIPTGPVQSAELRNMLPHESKIVTMTLTGAEIREVLEQSVENAFTDDPIRKVGGMIQVGGLRFSYSPHRSYGSPVGEVVIGDKVLEPERRYRAATNSMLAQGGHNYVSFTKGREVRAWVAVRHHRRSVQDAEAGCCARSRPDSPG